MKIKKEREWSDWGGSVLRRKGEITWEKDCFLVVVSKPRKMSSYLESFPVKQSISTTSSATSCKKA